MMQFNLDSMLRDNVIVSVPSFFQKLFKICSQKESLQAISNGFGMNQAIQVTKKMILDNLPTSLVNVFTKEKYFCVRNCNKK